MAFGKRGPKKQTKGRPLADDDWLTQYGSKANPVSCGCYFRHLLRPHERSLSMTLGRLTPEQAGPAIGQPVNGARHVTVGTLRAAGFDVVHSPSQEIPDHVSIIARGDWGKDTGDALNACFDDAQWHDDTTGGSDD